VDPIDDLDTRLGTFQRDDRPHVPYLVVDGDIDDRLVEDFTDALFKTIIDAHGTAVLDLTGVTYLGSNGIGGLITARALAHDHGVELTVEPSRIVRRVLAITGLAEFFGIVRELV
jgi:anti-sigma B factor antagonist